MGVDGELGEFPGEGFADAAKIVFLAQAEGVGRDVQMGGHGFVEAAVLVLDEDEAAELVDLDEETSPVPSSPMVLGKGLNGREGERAAGDHHKVVAGEI